MMTFALFYAAVVKACEGRYCSAQVEATFSPHQDTGEPVLTFRAYDNDKGWTQVWRLPELALSELHDMPRKSTAPAHTPTEVKGVDPLPHLAAELAAVPSRPF